MNEELISKKLDAICEEMRRGFHGNAEEHRRVFEALENIKVAAASDRNHIHEHCDDCVQHSAQIESIEKQMSIRDKLGIGATLALIGTAIKTWMLR